MNKLIHIVYGYPAAGTLKFFFENNENEYKGKIINFSDELSIGPIHKIDTKIGLANRINWFKEMYKETCILDLFGDTDNFFIDTYESIKSIEPDAKVIIWHGENVSSQLLLRYLSATLKNNELYEVNVSDSYIKDYNGNTYKPKALAMCSPESLNKIILTIKQIEKQSREQFINDWNKIKDSKENLRILDNNNIISVDENYYDDVILSNCSFDFTKAPKVVGATLGKSEQVISDTYIDYRVRNLVKNGKLQYKGALKNMRDYEIKLPDNFNS